MGEHHFRATSLILGTVAHFGGELLIWGKHFGEHHGFEKINHFGGTTPKEPLNFGGGSLILGGSLVHLGEVALLGGNTSILGSFPHFGGA